MNNENTSAYKEQQLNMLNQILKITKPTIVKIVSYKQGISPKQVWLVGVTNDPEQLKQEIKAKHFNSWQVPSALDAFTIKEVIIDFYDMFGFKPFEQPIPIIPTVNNYDDYTHLFVCGE